MRLRSRFLVIGLSTVLGVEVAIAQPDGTEEPQPTPGDKTTTTSAGSAGETPVPNGGITPTTEPATPAADAPATAVTGPTVSGFIDTTYNYNFNRPGSGKNTYFSYAAQHNNLSLNTADVAISGKVGDSLVYYVQADMGADATVNSYNYGVPTIFDIQEAYAAYTSKDKWGFKVGKFVTFNGIEVIESGSNPTISRGYLFGLAEPYTHVGGVLTYQATDKVDVALGVINGWDLLDDNNRAKMIVGKLGVNLGDPLLLTLSAYAGPDQPGNTDNWRTTFDLTGVTKQGKVAINFQANVGFEQKVVPTADPTAFENDSWFGLGIQPVFTLSDSLTLGTRAEMFRNDKGSRGVAPKALLFNLAVAPAYTITKNLVLRVEGRLDVSDKPAYETSDGTAKKNQVVGMAEAIASF